MWYTNDNHELSKNVGKYPAAKFTYYCGKAYRRNRKAIVDDKVRSKVVFIGAAPPPLPSCPRCTGSGI